MAHVYKKNKRACIFITDLLQLNTPNLLSSDTEGASNGKNISVIEGTFSYFLLGYIQQNNLRPELMRKIDNIIESISENEQISFHCFILNVLQSVSFYIKNLHTLSNLFTIIQLSRITKLINL